MTDPDEMLRYAMGSLTQPSVKLTDHMLRYAMGAMGIGSPKEAAKFRLFWNFAIEAMGTDKERPAEANRIAVEPVMNVDQQSRAMFVARLQAVGEDNKLSVGSVLALLIDCDYLASLSPAPAAPVAQPLTDEQASSLWREHLRVSDLDGVSIHGGVELIRAVEHAHRIGQGGA